MGRQRKSLNNEVGNVPMNDGIRRNVFRTILNALCFTLACALLSPLAAQADAVFVCTNASARSFQSCAFPSQWRLRDPAEVTNTNRVLYCPAGTTGNQDVSACPRVRWTTKPQIPAQGLVGVCFGAAGGGNAAACNISSGGGEGWQLKSVVFGAGTPPPAPTLTFTANPTSVASGFASTLTWSSANATSCTASGAWSGAKALSGSQSTGALTSDSTFILNCSGSGGSISGSVSVTIAVAPSAPTLTFTANPTSVASGFASTLTWSTTNATSCIAIGGWSGSKPISGSESTGALTAGTTFSLGCSGSGGMVSQSVTVAVTPASTPALAVFVCTDASAVGLFDCDYPSQWVLKNPPDVSDTDRILQCPSVTPGRGNLAECSVADWTTKPNIPDSGPLAVCFGAAGGSDVTACDISSGGGEGWELKSIVFGSGGSPPALTLTLTANPTSVASGSASTLNWSSTNATSCTASGAWSGSKATSGSQSTGALTSDSTFGLNCSGTGGSISRSVTVTIATTPPAPTLTFTANPTSVTSGGASTLTWNSANATSCTASGAWSGAKALSGFQSTGALTNNSTFALSCGGSGGMVSQSVTVTVAAAGTTFGLEFPGNGAVRRMLYWHNPFPIYDATYIFKVYPRKKTTGAFKYYTTFFWGNDGTFIWDGGDANTYYGAHPYPIPAPDGPGQWEISVYASDFVTGSEVVWDRWYTQAFRAWRESPSITHHEFYWDLPDTSKVITHTINDAQWAKKNPPTPAIVMGQAPNLNGASWGGYAGWEEFNGIIRGIQIYSGLLSVADIQAEIANPKSTVAGQNLIWYLNVNP
ncbi:MAG TPA: hypothetical protein VGB27_05340, partial [Candidatus Binatia bacterium]